MSFLVYDISFLIIFSLFVLIFLIKKRKNLSREGLIFLYRTKLGLKFIDKFAKSYDKILRPLEYVVLAISYVLMGSIVYMMIYSVYIYLKVPIVAQLIKAPPIVPLIPYFPKLFNLDSIFPDFYFTYFLVALLIVAVVHEFSHGIFARLNKIKIHSTGFAFFGPILGAFVEQDEKQMNNASKFSQMSILGAGVFANILFAGLFLLFLWLFFFVAFSPGGAYFNQYASTEINRTHISHIAGIEIENFSLSDLNLNETLVRITAENKSYFTSSEALIMVYENDFEIIPAYYDSPAFNNKIKGSIISINDAKINSYNDLSLELSKHSPGENILLTTISEGKPTEYNITLAENNGSSFIGIGLASPNTGFISGLIYKITPKINNLFNGIHYESNVGNLGTFIFHMFWWVMLINFLVALFNMLPLGILDGGRFFLLTVAGLTKNEKAGIVAYKVAKWFILLLLLAMMIKWLFAVVI